MELRSEPFDLEELLCDSLRLAAAGGDGSVPIGFLYPLAARRRFTGDPGRIRQIVMNLLGNAIKFTERGHVVVRVAVEEEQGRPLVTITVEDTGPGIAEDRHEVIFEAFAQVDDPRRPAKEGTGLGLTISRGLAERMGGTLTLHSGPGEGTTLTLALPLAPCGPPPTPPALPTRVAIPATRSLYGDLLEALLASSGVEVVRAVSAAEALVVLPLSLDAAEQEAVARLLRPGARLVALGPRGAASPVAASRAAAVIAMPATGAELSAALTAGPMQAPTALRGHASQSDRPRILLADDNATNRLLLDRMLRDQPFEIEIVTNGAEVAAAYRARRPDAVVLDISMPVIDGFEAAEAIREFERNQEGVPAPLLALTAHSGEEMAERLRAAGFRTHLTKPLRKDALLAALAEALAIRQAASRT